MNVYPENMIERLETLSSTPGVTNGTVRNVYHLYLDVIAEFLSNTVTISGDFGFYYPVPCAAFIIGNTNISTYRLILQNVNGTTILDSQTVSIGDEYIHIQDFPSLLTVRTFQLITQSDEAISTIGLLYLGTRLTLPQFTTGPTRSFTPQSESSRSMAGHAYGLFAPTLKSFSANFPRVDTRQLRQIETYIGTVLTIKPHIIDPYPEAREEYEPFYATLVEGIESEKRHESGFYWTTSLSWQEAK
jgi:hypothetical protein